MLYRKTTEAGWLGLECRELKGRISKDRHQGNLVRTERVDWWPTMEGMVSNAHG